MTMCKVDDCLRPAAKKRGGLCAACAQAKQRKNEPKREKGLPRGVTRYQSPFEMLMEAALNLADFDVDDDDGFARARDRLEKASFRHAGKRLFEENLRLQNELTTERAKVVELRRQLRVQDRSAVV